MSKILVDNDVLNQALEALEKYRKMMFVEAGCRFGEGDAAITSLRAVLAEPVQEPITRLFGTLPVHDAPPKPEPLTDEDIYEMYNEPCSDAEMVEFARAIERAHGIGVE